MDGTFAVGNYRLRIGGMDLGVLHGIRIIEEEGMVEVDSSRPAAWVQIARLPDVGSVGVKLSYKPVDYVYQMGNVIMAHPTVVARIRNCCARRFPAVGRFLEMLGMNEGAMTSISLKVERRPLS